MTKRNRNILFIVLLIALPIAWYLGSPLFINKEVKEELPFDIPTAEEVAAMSPEVKMEMHKKMMEMMSRMPKQEMKEEMPASVEPTVLAEGKFRDVDAIHRGMGTARLYRLSDNSHLLRLHEINIANGPDLYVYLVKHPDPKSASDVKEGFVSLGRLRGNIGSQNYQIPSDVTIDDYHSAVIFCQRFGVLFSPAPLKR